MVFFLQIFTWWNGQTLGTRIFTLFKGICVGKDRLGNLYYCTRGGERRWVVYKGEVEASRIAPEWHGWIHYTVDQVPSGQESPSYPNMTGTEFAHRPKGSILTPKSHLSVTRDYKAWRPE